MVLVFNYFSKLNVLIYFASRFTQGNIVLDYWILEIIL